MSDEQSSEISSCDCPTIFRTGKFGDPGLNITGNPILSITNIKKHLWIQTINCRPTLITLAFLTTIPIQANGCQNLVDHEMTQFRQSLFPLQMAGDWLAGNVLENGTISLPECYSQHLILRDNLPAVRWQAWQQNRYIWRWLKRVKAHSKMRGKKTFARSKKTPGWRFTLILDRAGSICCQSTVRAEQEKTGEYLDIHGRTLLQHILKRVLFPKFENKMNKWTVFSESGILDDANHFKYFQFGNSGFQ